MATDGAPVERLRGYLLQLPPAKRALLISELERALLRGDDVPGGDLLLQEVRSSVRATGLRGPRIGPVARLFFRPLEPFLIGDQLVPKQPARIARTSLPALWEWICRDVAPEAADRLSEAVTRELLGDADATCESLIRPFQDRVVARLGAMLEEIKIDDKARRRMTGQIGTPAALDEARDLHTILAGRDALAAMASRLPGHIPNLADGSLDQVRSIARSGAASAQALLPFALILVMGRLASPWQLIRLAVRGVDSDDAS